jgi:hypothetical protein
MKKILLLGSMLFALNGFSQSYVILNNGVTLTTDKAAFVYDFGHFILPTNVTLTGGQYLAEDGKFISVDEKGFLYRKDEKAPSKVKGKGSNYVIAENGNIFTFDAAGFVYKFDKDNTLKKASNFGGRFFTVKPDEKRNAVDLYTMNTKGNYFKMNVDSLAAADIAVFGGNYFMTNKNVVYTVSKDGFVFSKAEIKTGMIRKMGGNFFIDDKNAIYTVSDDGFLYLPSLPANLKVSTVTKLGANYFQDQEGRMFVVDSTGAIFEREMKSHDLRNSRILSM